MTGYEDFLLSTHKAVYDLVVSFDSIQVFGFGLWTWLLVCIFVTGLFIGVISKLVEQGWLE